MADGDWTRVALEEAVAKEFLQDLVRKIQDDPLDAAKQSSGRLQQSIMALRRGTFRGNSAGGAVQPSRAMQHAKAAARLDCKERALMVKGASDPEIRRRRRMVVSVLHVREKLDAK